MSGIRAAEKLTGLPDREDTQGLQDILYEILATGVDPARSSVTTEEIERFLHEHARSSRSRDDFVAFFDAHNLCRNAPGHAVDLGPRRVVATSGETEPVVLRLHPSDDTQPHVIFEMPEPPQAAVGGWGLRIALGLSMAALVAVVGIGHSMITSLQHELERSRALGADNRLVIEAIQQSARSLRSSVTANSEVMRRLDARSETPIETPPEDKQ